MTFIGNDRERFFGSWFLNCLPAAYTEIVCLSEAALPPDCISQNGDLLALTKKLIFPNLFTSYLMHNFIK
ncbi:hypothetical protein A361_06685 [Cytobacillus oceanisediminis 2691]|uniref:Uncharacterized protein n=1 Tax=Cytobacillus oceanisediminis 2691 TaxID=1196031 RepID=A0A160M876_9BACI|nr:hypothetical protein A361_06685 [Cytobacillus oceanisediminis 2691]